MRRFLSHFEEIMGSFCLVAVGLIVTLQVIARYLVGHALSWPDETSRYLFVWITFLGASLALKKREHFALELLPDSLPPKAARWLEIGVMIVVLLTTLMLIWYGIVLTLDGHKVLTPTLEIPRSLPYAAIPFGALLMTIRATEHLLRLIRGAGPGKGAPR